MPLGRSSAVGTETKVVQTNYLPDSLIKRFRMVVADTNAQGQDILAEAAQMGEDIVKERIETSPANNGELWKGDWSGAPHGHANRDSSYPGRVASGKMLNAVSHWVSREGRDGKTRMAFGWTNPATREEYFLSQEYGFDHNIANRHIEGMFAIQNAYDEVRAWVKSQMTRVAKGSRFSVK